MNGWMDGWMHGCMDGWALAILREGHDWFSNIVEILDTRALEYYLSLVR